MAEDVHNLVPRPDPTSLTTEQLHREIKALAETFDLQLTAQAKLNDEKFHGIATQFAERDKRTEQLSLADKTAIAAALQAQKEAAGATNESNAAAIAKSELGFTKQIDQLVLLITTTTKSIDDKINDLKGRVDTGVGHGSGLKDGWGYVFGAVMLAVAVGSFVLRNPG